MFCFDDLFELAHVLCLRQTFSQCVYISQHTNRRLRGSVGLSTAMKCSSIITIASKHAHWATTSMLMSGTVHKTFRASPPRGPSQQGRPSSLADGPGLSLRCFVAVSRNLRSGVLLILGLSLYFLSSSATTGTLLVPADSKPCSLVLSKKFKRSAGVLYRYF